MPSSLAVTEMEELNNTLQEEKETRENETNDVHKELLYLVTYSRRENLKFDGIPERLILIQVDSHKGQKRNMEDTKGQLVDFLENVPEVEDARDIECQRIHRLGKNLKTDGSRRMIIARFLRFSDLEKSSGARIN